LNFPVVSHPKATLVTDDIFQYLIVEYGNNELSYVDVFTAERYGVYDLEKKWGIRCFVNWDSFEKEMPHVAKAVKEDRENGL
jgi:hypothetical protein